VQKILDPLLGEDKVLGCCEDKVFGCSEDKVLESCEHEVLRCCEDEVLGNLRSGSILQIIA
jgi:hypothetical protein